MMLKKKIGILTFHTAHNFGAVLQAFALQESIKNLGYEVEIIDYRPKYITKSYRPFIINKDSVMLFLKTIASSLALFLFRNKRRKQFKHFVKKELKLSATVNKKFPDYDVYIVGSDQVWNTSITKGFDKFFWGDFETKASSKKITYAVSSGYGDWQNNQMNKLSKLIQNFNHISVREPNIGDFFQKLTINKIEVVLDPTLLLSDDFWSKQVIKPNIAEQYILIYQVQITEKIYKIAKYVAEHFNAKIIEVPSIISISNMKNKQIAISPFEFLGLIKYSHYVISSSYHGTAFSIIFEKQFLSVVGTSKNDTRVVSLLEPLGLRDRVIKNESQLSTELIENKINYKEAKVVLHKKKENSLGYIIHSLS